jgi:hypothetical protein
MGAGMGMGGGPGFNRLSRNSGAPQLLAGLMSGRMGFSRQCFSTGCADLPLYLIIVVTTAVCFSSCFTFLLSLCLCLLHRLRRTPPWLTCQRPRSPRWVIDEVCMDMVGKCMGQTCSNSARLHDSELSAALLSIEESWHPVPCHVETTAGVFCVWCCTHTSCTPSSSHTHTFCTSSLFLYLTHTSHLLLVPPAGLCHSWDPGRRPNHLHPSPRH